MNNDEKRKENKHKISRENISSNIRVKIISNVLNKLKNIKSNVIKEIFILYFYFIYLYIYIYLIIYFYFIYGYNIPYI